MSISIIRAAALALLAGIACMPAHAQNSGSSDLDIGVQLDPVKPLPDDTITPLPEGEVPVVRKKRQRDVVQPGPDTNELPPAIDPIPQGETPRPRVVNPGPDPEGQPRKRRRPEPEIVQPGPDDEVVPKRRRPRPEIAEPGPESDAGPSADQIERQLDARPRIRLAPGKRVTIREFERRPDLRRAAPSIDIQAINFATSSAEVPVSQYRKVENIAIALDRLLRRDPETLVLIEGHTDAVGSFASNQALSERRAASLKRVLVREFDIPREALETVGYGEEDLLIPTTTENWKNRRVTLRAVNDFVR